MRGGSMVRYDEYAEFMRATVTESAVNTYTETTITTPVGRSTNLAMVIHGIEVEALNLTYTTNTAEIAVQLTTVTQSGILNLNNPNLIFKHRTIHFYTATANGTAAASAIPTIYRHWFPVPLLYAKSQMFFGIKQASAASAASAQISILYTIRRISLYKMLEALTD